MQIFLAIYNDPNPFKQFAISMQCTSETRAVNPAMIFRGAYVLKMFGVKAKNEIKMSHPLHDKIAQYKAESHNTILNRPINVLWLAGRRVGRALGSGG